MSLTVALNSARSSLMAAGTQASVISRNIAGVAQDGYSRKNALLRPLPGNGVYVAGIQRADQCGTVLQCPEGLLDLRKAGCALQRPSENRG